MATVGLSSDFAPLGSVSSILSSPSGAAVGLLSLSRILGRTERISPLCSPSIFCWLVVAAGTWEESVLPAFHKSTLSWCDSWRIFSNVSRLPFQTPVTPLWDEPLSMQRSGQHGTALNTSVLLEAWRQLLSSEAVWRQHEWIVKLNVDTLLLVPTLRRLQTSAFVVANIDRMARRCWRRVPGCGW